MSSAGELIEAIRNPSESFHRAQELTIKAWMGAAVVAAAGITEAVSVAKYATGAEDASYLAENTAAVALSVAVVGLILSRSSSSQAPPA